MADAEQRHSYKRAFKQQIHAFLDNGALSPGTALEIVTTKLDKLTPQTEGRALIEELDAFEAATLAEFSGVADGEAGVRATASQLPGRRGRLG